MLIEVLSLTFCVIFFSAAPPPQVCPTSSLPEQLVRTPRPPPEQTTSLTAVLMSTSTSALPAPATFCEAPSQPGRAPSARAAPRRWPPPFPPILRLGASPAPVPPNAPAQLLIDPAAPRRRLAPTAEEANDSGLSADVLHFPPSAQSADLTALVRDSLLLALPALPSCGPSCRGAAVAAAAGSGGRRVVWEAQTGGGAGAEAGGRAQGGAWAALARLRVPTTTTAAAAARAGGESVSS